MGIKLSKNKGIDGGMFSMMPRDVFLIIYHMLSNRDQSSMWNISRFFRKWLEDVPRVSFSAVRLADSVTEDIVRLRLKIVGNSERKLPASNGDRFTEMASKYAHEANWSDPCPPSILCSVNTWEKVSFEGRDIRICFDVNCEHLGVVPWDHLKWQLEMSNQISQVFMFHYDGAKWEEELSRIKTEIQKLKSARTKNVRKFEDRLGGGSQTCF